MPETAPSSLRFVRLTEVAPAALAELLNHPEVRRHMPLSDAMSVADVARWVAEKERIWEREGYGPYAILVGTELAGWGGLEPESYGLDVGIVLYPRHWGLGQEIFWRLADEAFGKVGADSVVILFPHSRTRVRALMRHGMRADGEVVLDGVPFRRFRLDRPKLPTGSHRTGVLPP